MSTAIVAGGGIAGLLAAKLLKRRHGRVLVVERDAVCGGLLGSIVNADGAIFDHGAHVLSETGVAEIDELLYGDLSKDDWHEFRILRAGNWFGGAMNGSSSFPDARRLGDEVLAHALDELAEAAVKQYTVSPVDLAELLERRFGATLATQVAGPAIRKQLGVEPAQLHPETPFFIRRVVCADAEESRRLKQDARFSEPVAFASYEEGVGALRHLYPRTGGIGQWVDSFVAGLRRDGVEFACGRVIASVDHAGGKITAATLDDGQVTHCDVLAWTLPSAMLLRATGIPFQGRPPTPRPIGLFHLVFDTPFADANYHITCYDEALHTFRVTLYPNLRGAAKGKPYNCTVEVIGTADTDFPALLPEVVRELRVMGVIPAEAQLLSSLVKVVPMGFPATTHAFMADNAAQAALARQHLGNALLLGRARCPPFFTSDVLVDVFRNIESCAHG